MPPQKHPFLSGNFAPIHSQLSHAPCSLQGRIPPELLGGQYVRNGSNPLPPPHPSAATHWFDGHGMLSAVLISPQGHASYSNRYIHTDIFLAEGRGRHPPGAILPSIATLIDPRASPLTVLAAVLRTLWAVLRSWLDGSPRPIRRISVANTGIHYHDGRVLASCESGPLMRVTLPDLKTVGWLELGGPGFPGRGLTGFFREWTTGHPHVDPVTGEMMLFHSTFFKPYVRYSVLGPSKGSPPGPLLGHPIPGIASPKMMHDFGVSRGHTVIIDLPLSLDPLALLRGRPVIQYSPEGPTRFGLFPRHSPDQVRWFSSDACCIFHTVNTWDEQDDEDASVNMLVCRMSSPSVVYAAGNVPPPSSDSQSDVRLHYYRFPLADDSIRQFPLSAIAFEFPHVPKHLAMSATPFVYGCTCTATAPAHSGDDLKINTLVKMNVHTLIARGLANPPTTGECVDARSPAQILASTDPHDPIQLFVMPDGYFAQECVFVPRENPQSDDDGYLLTFVFDEAQLDADGDCPDDATSEFWVIDAKSMSHVEARLRLPQRVPYGLHGNWFSRDEIRRQRD